MCKKKISYCDKTRTQTFTIFHTINITKLKCLINRPGGPGGVLQTPSAIHPFKSKSSKHHYSQTVRCRDLNFDTMFTTRHVSCVKCHLSCVMCVCPVSRVTCHLSRVMHNFIKFFFWLDTSIYIRTKSWKKLVKGLLSKGPTLFSFWLYSFF